jgi:hypothetical protein
MEGDVELAEGDLGAAQLGDAAAQPLRNGHAPRVDPHEGDALEIRIALDDLVRDSRERALDRLGIEDSLRFGGLRAQGALRALLTLRTPFRPHRTELKGWLSVRNPSGRVGRYSSGKGRSKSDAAYSDSSQSSCRSGTPSERP